jgi:hypothetical protein
VSGYAPDSDIVGSGIPLSSGAGTSVGALDDLLAGVQASSLSPSPPVVPRPGRVSPPNGSVDPGSEGS